MRALVVAGLVAASAAQAASPLERARTAVAAEPDRPGLRLVLAELLFEAGDLAAAEAEANRVLSAWIASHRARLLLARIDAARGRDDMARDALADVAARAPAPIAAEALRLLHAPVPSPWGVGARVGVDYDSAAARTCAAECEDADAWRALVAADVAYERPRWAVRAGADVARETEADAAVISAWMDARAEVDAGPGRLGGRLEGRALSGDDRDRAGGGGSVWIRGLDPAFAPWAQVRALYFRYPESARNDFDFPIDAGELQAEAAAGVRFGAGRFEGGPRLAALWVPDTFREYGADLHAGVDLAPARLFARVGAGWRDHEDEAFASELRPRAGGGAALALGGGFSLVAEALWQAARADGDDALRDRLITGVHLDMRR